MSFKSRYLQSVIFIIGSLISLWFLITNLQQIKPAPYAFAVCIIIGLYLAIKVFSNDVLTKARKYVLNQTKRKYFVAIALSTLTMVGLLVRLFFYFRFSYAPVSDPVTFYDSAMKLAAGGGSIGNSYVAFQPYLSAYNNILGLAMRVIPDPWLATIALNTLFDILSCITIYIFLRKLLKPGSKLPIVAFGVWMLNPLNIIFSVISIPVIIVNFFVIVTILITYLVIQQITNLKTKNSLLLSVALGLALGLGNCFRPVFIVPIIALAIVCIFLFLTTHKNVRFLKLSLISIILPSIIFTVIQFINVSFVSNQTELPAAKNPSGWSMYVGSSRETNGEWRPYHNDDLRRICESSLLNNDFNECHNQLRSEAFERYKNYGLAASKTLFIEKLYHQAEEQGYFYNAEHSIVGYPASRTYKVISVAMVLYMVALFLLSAKSLYRLAKQAATKGPVNLILLFTALIMIGWFFSFMLVESAPRYSTILYPMFIIFALLTLENRFGQKISANH